MGSVRGLECRECGQLYPAEPLHVCEMCFGPLEVAYDYDVIRNQISREEIARGPLSLWRYKKLLPIEGDRIVDSQAGFTPLVQADNLARALGLRNVYVKNDTVNPTFSFKDRPVSIASTKALEFGFEVLACASTGNLAGAVAAHAAKAGMRACVIIPADLEPSKIVGALVYGPTVVAVDGNYDDVNRVCSEIADKYRWAFVNVNFRPYYSEGSKSYGFEIVEQLGWRTPAHIVVPCAGGSLITKIWKAIKELKILGLLDERLKTKMHAAQALGCGPIVTMIKNDTDVLVPVRPNTIAKSLAIGNPADGYYAYKTTKESGGSGEHATDEEIVEGMLLLARTEGIFTETAGGVTVAAARKLIERGVIARDESIVICITGNGLKTPDALQDRLDAHVKINPSLSAFDRALADLKSQTS